MLLPVLSELAHYPSRVKFEASRPILFIMPIDDIGGIEAMTYETGWASPDFRPSLELMNGRQSNHAVLPGQECLHRGMPGMGRQRDYKDLRGTRALLCAQQIYWAKEDHANCLRYEVLMDTPIKKANIT